MVYLDKSILGKHRREMPPKKRKITLARFFKIFPINSTMVSFILVKPDLLTGTVLDNI